MLPAVKPRSNVCVEQASLVERGLNPNQTTDAKFTYGCGAVRCSSGKIGGWVTR